MKQPDIRQTEGQLPAELIVTGYKKDFKLDLK